jgi:hypothetical protein
MNAPILHNYFFASKFCQHVKKFLSLWPAQGFFWNLLKFFTKEVG